MTPETPSLRPRIDFLVNVQNTSGRRVAIQDARALVGLPGTSMPTRTIGFAYAVGTGHWELAREKGDALIRFALFLDEATIERIERVRANQKLRIVLDFTFVGIPLEGEMTTPPALRVETRGELTIGKSDWVDDFLPGFGLRPAIGLPGG